MTGLIAALASAAVYSLGLAVEQRALHRSADISIRRPLHLARVLLGDFRWLCGCALAALGSAGLIVSLGLAPVSIVQPAFAGGIALTLLLLALAQRQRLTGGELLALGLMPLALGVLSLSLGSDGEAGTAADIPLLLVVSALTLTVCVGGMVLAGRGGRGVSAALMGATAGLAQGVAGLQGKGVGGLLAQHGAAGALFPVLLSPFPFLYVLGWAVGIVLFQTSMQRARASVTAPVASVVGNIFMVVFGTVIFAERLPAEPLPLALRVLGVALTLAVVVLLRGAGSRVEEETARSRTAEKAAGPGEDRPGPGGTRPR